MLNNRELLSISVVYKRFEKKALELLSSAVVLLTGTRQHGLELGVIENIFPTPEHAAPQT